jgi:hypothetical protein
LEKLYFLAKTFLGAAAEGVDNIADLSLFPAAAGVYQDINWHYQILMVTQG